MAPHPTNTKPTMGRVEFIALMAMLGGTVAFSIDAMLPALPRIGAELSPDAINRAQLVITSFVFGMGAGTFLMGPLSDAFGRKPVVMVGALIYAFGAVLAVTTASLELLIASRLIQGLGVSTARVVSMAIIRDLYVGREMARLMSFVTMVFMIVPAIAPLIGTGIIAIAGWRGIFGSFILFAIAYSLWMGLRLPEPLPPANRRPFLPRTLWQAASEVLSYRTVQLSIAVQTLCFALLFAALSSIHPIIADTFGRASQFPYWFAMIAATSAGASLLNASLVLRLGMRRLISLALATQVILCLLALSFFMTGPAPDIGFAIFIAWQAALFSTVSLTLGNLNALAMEPLGHIAGMGASVTNGLATVGSVLLAVPIGLAFDGTPVPLIVGVAVCALLARLLMIPLNRAEQAAQS